MRKLYKPNQKKRKKNKMTEEFVKVTCVWGKFPSKDFVLEPYVEDDEEHSEVLYIKRKKELSK